MGWAAKIRPATTGDAAAISRLILSLARFFTVDPGGRGAEDFLLSLQPDAVAARLASASFKTWVAVADGSDVAGVIVVRGGHHIFHLFVAEAFQAQGGARALWRHVLPHLPPGARVTVNATLFAHGFYERMGFVATGPAVQTAGIAFIPMAWRCHGEGGGGSSTGNPAPPHGPH
ncbi:MAG: GNAT family N-acetyltransferase [Acidovorax sp.]|nr:MAG: GNAT family N-acetyltransferase [Acidovorax sp.]